MMEKSKQLKQKVVKVLAISDTHDKHSEIDIDNWPQADIFIHAGDFTKYSSKQQLQRFRQFLKNLPYQHKIVIAGNHDSALNRQKYEQQLKFNKHKHEVLSSEQQINKLRQCCTYLQHQMVQIQGVRIFGSPQPPEYFDWNFMYAPVQGEQIWTTIPKDIDILITHGPPYGILDYTLTKVNSGCQGLLKFVEKLKPKIHIFGHIHEGYGEKKVGDIHFYNASYVNTKYKPINEPHLIEIKVIVQSKEYEK